MDFTLNEDQQLLADSVKRFLEKNYDFEARRRIVGSEQGCSEQVWQGFAELGLLALPLPGEYGGFDGSAVDLMAVMECFGEALVVEPYVSTVLAARLLARAGSVAQKEAILPAVAEGRTRLAFAHTEDDGGYEFDRVRLSATRDGDGWLLNGLKKVVLGAPGADQLLVSARADAGISLFLVAADAPGLRIDPCVTLDEMRAADLRFESVRLEADALLDGAAADALALIEENMDFAIALLAAEAVGIMKFTNETTLEYLKTRRQFGVPIGSFQALQHRMVDMFIAAEQARSMACLACSKVDSAPDASDRRRAVSAAKIKIADACRLISQESIQLHGGMGMAEEMMVSHAFRRLTMAAQQFGDADHHLELFAGLGA